MTPRRPSPLRACAVVVAVFVALSVGLIEAKVVPKAVLEEAAAATVSRPAASTLEAGAAPVNTTASVSVDLAGDVSVANRSSLQNASSAGKNDGLSAALPASPQHPWLKQISILTERNRRLEAEIDGLKDAMKQLEDDTLAKRKAIADVELSAAEAKQKAAEAEVLKAREATRAAAEAAKAAEMERLSAAQASEAVRKALEEKKANLAAELEAAKRKQSVAELELQQVQAEVIQVDSRIRQLELELKLASHRLQEAIQSRLAAEAQATTRLAELEVLSKQAEADDARARAFAAETERLRAEDEKRISQADKLLEQEAKASAIRRQEMEAADALARQRDVERIRLEEESAKRREELRKGTEEQIAVAKAEAEAKGRVLELKETEDIRARQAAADAHVTRERLLASIQAVSQQVKESISTALTNNLQATVTAVLGLAAALHGGKALVALLQRIVAQFFGKPSLVRESSRPSFVMLTLLAVANVLTCGCAHAARRRRLEVTTGSEWLASEVRLLASRLTCGLLNCSRGRRGKKLSAAATAAGGAVSPSKETAEDASRYSFLSDVILEPATASKVRRLAAATRTAHERGAPLRHALLHGPPGTGKTLVAQRIARHCGLDYAVMSGGDVAALGSAAIEELHRLFDWAASSPFGLVLFIDEAEAFLGSRFARGSGATSSGGQGLHKVGGAAPSDQQTTQLNALATLLQHTGTNTAGATRVSLILATNRPQDLDEAVLDRMDDVVHFPLPSKETRVKMGSLYFHTFVSGVSQYRDVVSGSAPLPPPSADSSKLKVTKGNVCFSRKEKALLRLAPCVTASVLEEVCSKAEGFSGRQIAKLMLKVQAEAYADAAEGVSTFSKDHKSAGDALTLDDGGAPWVTAALLRRCIADELVSVRRSEFAAASNPPTPVALKHISFTQH